MKCASTSQKLQQAAPSVQLWSSLTLTTPANWQKSVADQVTVSSGVGQGWAFTNLSFFAQDVWKITRRLTATYGIRWDINPAPSSPNGTPMPPLNESLSAP